MKDQILRFNEKSRNDLTSIEWVNHASFVIRHNGTALLCDPWIEGTAFDNGWKPISKTRFNYNDFENIDYIWFSHEHPDHFSPPNLKNISPEARSKITILYQKTRDKKILGFCKKTLKFKEVIELEPFKTYSIGSDFEVQNGPLSSGDSWLFVRAGQHRILNLNDCIVNKPEIGESIADKVGTVDILATQFSYANWIGNPADKLLRRQSAVEKLNRISIQSKVFKPHTIIPFASFIWFCHEDNFYMNDEVNQIRNVYNFIQTELNRRAAVLYPGDVWDISKGFDSLASVLKYEEDASRIFSNPQLIKSQKVPIEQLLAEGKRFFEKLRKNNATIRLKFLKPAYVFLKDHNEVLRITLDNVEPVDGKVGFEISTTSDALLYCFQNLWGGDTLHVNARFQASGAAVNFWRYFEIAALNNRGEQFPGLKEYLLNRANRLSRKIFFRQ